MKKQVSSPYTQLTLNFEFEATSTASTLASEERSALPADYFHFTKADFEEWQALENDLMFGRGAYLFNKVERELAFQHMQAQTIREFEAIRASIYQ